MFSKTVFSMARSTFRMCSVMVIFKSSIVWGLFVSCTDFLITLYSWDIQYTSICSRGDGLQFPAMCLGDVQTAITKPSTGITQITRNHSIQCNGWNVKIYPIKYFYCNTVHPDVQYMVAAQSECSVKSVSPKEKGVEKIWVLLQNGSNEQLKRILCFVDLHPCIIS